MCPHGCASLNRTHNFGSEEQRAGLRNADSLLFLTEWQRFAQIDARAAGLNVWTVREVQTK